MSQNNEFTVVLAAPRGFCAGVERAISTVKQALAEHGPPIYVLHEIVHNKHVLLELEELGAIFVERLSDIPAGGICVFSAHGVAVQVEQKAKRLGLRTIDATCPLVASVHRMVERYHETGYDVIIIGHHKHPEVEGTAGRVEGRVHIVATESEAEEILVTDPTKVAYVTQTTLSQDDMSAIRDILRRRYPAIKGPTSNICFATENRQDAVRRLAAETDLIFVVGSKNSSNSNRLREVARKAGTAGYLIDDWRDIEVELLRGVSRVGITAGASAPERLVAGVVDFLRRHGASQVVTMAGIAENVHFRPACL